MALRGGVDDQLVAFCGDEYDEFEEVGGLVRTDDEPSVWVFAEVVDNNRMVDSVEDVVVGDAVASGGRVDLHS